MTDVEKATALMLSKFPNAVPLRKGGQKSVYRVDHPKHGSAVAKVGIADAPETMERISREVELLKDLDSDYYPKNFEFWKAGMTGFVTVEEYIPGDLLTSRIDKYQDSKEAASFIKSLCIGLRILWDEQVVHRDIKPDNIIITPGGQPKIIDLGIARCLKKTSLTESLAWVGPCTPPYAAPEQLLNRKADIDWRADQFSLGIVFVQLLSAGSHPFDPLVVGGSSIPANILQANWNRATLDARQCKPLAELCSRMLGREPYLRYRRVGTLFAELDKVLDGGV